MAVVAVVRAGVPNPSRNRRRARRHPTSGPYSRGVKHSQLIDKLAAGRMPETLDADLARLVWRGMVDHGFGRVGSVLEYVLPRLLSRWNCVLEATDDEVSPLYRSKTWLALATLLHKYGLADPQITARALAAIDELNDAVALSDAFFQRSEEFKKELQEAPKPLTRKPSVPDSITFYRARDVIGIQLDGRFYAAYVLECAYPNASPVIEFYDGVLDHLPRLEEVVGLPARGWFFKGGDGPYVRRLSVIGLKYEPDPANQITLIGACVPEPPDNSALKRYDALYTSSDIFEIQQDIRRMFAK